MSQYGPPENPYGQPQLPPQGYGQQYAPPQQQPVYGQAPPQYQPQQPPQRSQALAIISLVGGIIAVVAALPVATRGFAFVIGLAAVVLAIIALIHKKQGGTMLAAGGLAAGLVAMPLAVLMYMFTVSQQTGNERQQQQIADCIENQPDDILACSGLD